MSIQKCVGMTNSRLGRDKGQSIDDELCGVWRSVGQRVREEREDATRTAGDGVCALGRQGRGIGL